MPSRFESEACSRCLGSGKYSYCPMYGDVCFRCRGSGSTLTKRGAVAQAFLLQLLSKRGADLKVGDSIRIHYGLEGKSRWFPIRAIEPNSQVPGCFLLTLDDPAIRYGVDPEGQYRVAHSADAKQAALGRALAFQATLTKAGTVRKRAGKVEQ